MQRAIFITLAATLCLSVLHPAYADEPDSKLVSVSGIDPATQHGADHILRRIRHAARDVCDARIGAQPMTELRVQQQCMRDTMNLSVAELNDPAVTARYGRESTTQLASR